MIQSAISHLKGTIYEQRAPLEMAPFKSDCLTSIHYIYQRVLRVDFPTVFVGDMPRTLLSTGQWRLMEIDQKEASAGDLIFAKRILTVKLISHAAFVLGPHAIFNCRGDLGAVVETWDDFFSVFEQKLSETQIHYIDPRNKELRAKYKGKYIC